MSVFIQDGAPELELLEKQARRLQSVDTTCPCHVYRFVICFCFGPGLGTE